MSCHPIDAFVDEVGTRQEALWSGRQAQAAGASRELIRRRVQAGRWVDHGHRVYGPPGVPWTYPRRLWAAHLAVGPDSTVSHESVAVLRGIPGHRGTPVVLLRPHSGHARLEGIVVHQISDCRPEHRTTIGGLPVTTTTRTFVDLAATWSRARLAHALEAAVSARLVRLDDVAMTLRDVARRGKPGVALLAGILDDQTGAPPPASELERRIRSLLIGSGLRDPDRQRPLPGRGGLPGLVDFLYEEAKLIIEGDGRRWHDRRSSMLRDRDRDNEAAAAGYHTMRLMWERVTGDPIATGRLVAATYADRLRLLRAA